MTAEVKDAYYNWIAANIELIENREHEKGTRAERQKLVGEIARNAFAAGWNAALIREGAPR